jgi:hypothetical protein
VEMKGWATPSPPNQPLCRSCGHSGHRVHLHLTSRAIQGRRETLAGAPTLEEDEAPTTVSHAQVWEPTIAICRATFDWRHPSAAEGAEWRERGGGG